MKRLRLVGWILGGVIAASMGVSGGPGAADPPAEKAAPRDPALEKVGELVGGRWVLQGKLAAEMRYEWRMKGQVLRATGVIGKGSPGEVEVETLFGWDPVGKTAFYLDFHGHQTVFQGTMKAEGNAVLSEFKQISGTARFRARDELLDKDTLASTIYGEQNGAWVELHRLQFKRQPNAAPAAAAPPRGPAGDLNPALAKLGSMVGRWTATLKTPERDLEVESRSEWAFHVRGLRAFGLVGKGAPEEFEIETRYGWDPAAKQVTYLALHGSSEVFKGTVKVEGDAVEHRFERLIGPPAHWRSLIEIPKPNTMLFTLFRPEGTGWEQMFRLEYHRQPG